MSEPQVGDNQLKSIVSRINSLEDEKKQTADLIRDVYAEAKSSGMNPKALRAVVRRQRQDATALAQFEADVALYMQSLGMERL